MIADISELKHRLELQEPQELDDGAGGVFRTYHTLTTLWAAITQITPQPHLSQDRLNQLVTRKIVIRYREGITRLHRFKMQDRIFKIQSIAKLDVERWFMEIITEEDVP